MFYLKQSTSGQIDVLLVQTANGYTPASGIASPDVLKIAKAGSDFANFNDGTWIQKLYGWYGVQVDATDANTLGKTRLHVEASGARNFDDFGFVLTENEYNSRFGSDNQEVDIVKVSGIAVDITDFRADIIALSSDVSAIKVKTDNLPNGIKRNTALPNFTFIITSGTTPITGATVSAKRVIDGVGYNDCTNTGSISGLGYGTYGIDFSTDDLNGRNIMFMMTTDGGLINYINIITEE